jgi:ATP-dependent RNA helicase RhlE
MRRKRRRKKIILNENMNSSSTPNGFAELGIGGTLLAAAVRAGFEHPKPIQTLAIPPYLEGRDVLGLAQTGSGKTAAFALPILSRIAALGTKRLPRTARALILAPTRELAVQIEEVFRELAKGLHLSTALVLGGVSRASQVKRLHAGVDVLVATPGRLVDLVREKDVSLAETRFLVLDEADRMLDMGFLPDVKRLVKATHRDRQTSLFSATMPAEIEALAGTLLKDPVRVEAAPQSTTASEIAQSVVMARTRQKRGILAGMLAGDANGPVLVFARTKHGADVVTRNLERDGFAAAVIHGNKSQNARQRALNGFRDGSVRILVATDIAARGIDVPGISHVINYDLPDEAESYVHRIGRTGRNGADGIAVTLCDPAEVSKLRQVERIIRMRLPVTASHLDQPDPAPQPRERPVRAENADQRQHHRPKNPRSAPNGVHAAGRKGPHGKPAGQPREEAGGENRHALPRQLMDKPTAKKPFRNRKRRGNFRRQATKAA